MKRQKSFLEKRRTKKQHQLFDAAFFPSSFLLLLFPPLVIVKAQETKLMLLMAWKSIRETKKKMRLTLTCLLCVCVSWMEVLLKFVVF